jgi:predicted MPP superfamily phosphohydrolase
MQKDTILYGIILFIVLWAFLEQKLLITAKHTVTSRKLPKQLDNTGFVLLADLHNSTFGKNNQRLLRRIDAMGPDFIIMAGDMINKKDICYPSSAFTLVEQLSMKYPVYYAYGNHEQKLERIGREASSEWSQEQKRYYSTWVEFKNRLGKLNVIFLDNESTVFEHNASKLRITGVSLERAYFEFNSSKELTTIDLTNLVGESHEERYQILIAHNPVYFKAYADWGADLTLSGHLHGGLMRLPGIGGVISPQAKLFPKYDHGKHTHGEHHLVVSRGLGSHSIMPRLFNIPEIIYIKLKKEPSR